MSTAHFCAPDSVRLCTGETLALLSCDESDVLSVDGADLRDAFYRVGLPAELRGLFTMRSLSAGALGLKTLNGRELQSSARVVPRVCVAPMGGTWAPWWM